MVQINYTIRPFIKSATQQVAIRVRWCSKSREVTFITGTYADPQKWDDDLGKAKKNTTHMIRKHRFTSSEINERIAMYRQEIDICFQKFAREDRIPSQEELKAFVNGTLRPEENKTDEAVKVKSMKELFADFLSVNTREKNWSDLVVEKYQQSFNHLMKAVPRLRITNVSKETMFKLRDWYVSEGYANTTVNHRFTVIKAIFKWISENTIYRVPNEIFTFRTNLKEAPQTITFLTYEELQSFFNYKFTNKRLEKAKDQFCFMAFTSLRISDFQRLMVGNLVDGHIEIIAKKTDERMVIPLTQDAQAIIEKYKNERPKDGHLFDAISGQKLNDYIKEAAKEAGLNRKVLFSYYKGTVRIDEQKEFWETISCHDARRTFVSCSLAMGIPENFVRRCSGHKNLRGMAPYMGVSIEAQTLEMDKWNKSQYRSQIISKLDAMKESELQFVLSAISDIDKLNQAIKLFEEKEILSPSKP